MSGARYQLGPLRVAPWAALHDVAYVRSLLTSGQQLPADITATAGAGLRAYLRNGAKVTWTAALLPEYVWWRKQADRRQLDGRYELGFHGFFNHLTVEATAGRRQQLGIITPELPVLANARQDGVELAAELTLTPALFTFASGTVNDQTVLVDATGDPRLVSLHLLDRRERVAQGGLRWQPRQDLWVALGIESSRVDFARTALPRSNGGTSPLLRFHYRGPVLGFEGELASRSLSARQGSDFVPYHKTTGNASLQVGSGRTFAATLYGSRNLIYALSAGNAYLQDDRLGLSFQGALGRRVGAHIFGETGTDDYTAFAAGVPHRRDDVSSVGGNLSFNLGHNVVVGFQALRSRYVPNLTGSSVTYTSAGMTISVGGIVGRPDPTAGPRRDVAVP
ncbi:MAG TPA: hypothetical protein VLX28_26235 [Thermoanaerobaculia bacterium]|nr:hypothetical protein [Thermoanaerobaculia bacterium]